MAASAPLLRRRPLVAAGMLVLVLASLTACGDDDKTDGSAATQTTAPEDVKAPLPEVVAKLPTMVAGGAKAATAAAKGDFKAAEQEFEELHEVWEDIEGTIKDSDPDAYEKIETAQGLIRDGAESKNAKRVTQGAKDQASAVAEFVKANGT